MLRGNLSTRPFYNERLVGLALTLLFVIAIAATLLNARELIARSGERAAPHRVGSGALGRRVGRRGF